MDENKKEYEIGYVDITTEEYKDIITQMVESRKDAEFERERRWRTESELNATKEELQSTKGKLISAYNRIDELLDELLARHKSDTKEVTNNG